MKKTNCSFAPNDPRSGRAGNRTRHVDDNRKLGLRFPFHPTLRLLHALQQTSTLGNMPEKLGDGGLVGPSC